MMVGMLCAINAAPGGVPRHEDTHASASLALDAGEDAYVFVTAVRPSGSTYAVTASPAR